FEEKAWLNEHNGVIRVGALSDYLPFVGIKEGEMVGLMSHVFNAMKEVYGIKVELHTYDDAITMHKALNEDKIDIMGPVVADFYLAEQDECVLTDAMINTNAVVLYRKGADLQKSLEVIAANEESAFNPRVLHVMFPNSEIHSFRNAAESMKAVADGKADCMIIPSGRINIARADPSIDRLAIAEMNQLVDVCFLTSMPKRRVASIVNKAILHSSVALHGVAMTEFSNANTHMTLMEFFRVNAGYGVAFSAIIIGILGTLLFIAYRSHRKQQQAAKAAQRANKAKTTFLFNMSHDIRTPMNAIIGYTRLIEKHQNDKERCFEYLKKIESSSEMLLSLINNVLEMARVESGKVMLDEMICETAGLGQHINDVYAELMKEKGIDFSYTSDVRTPYIYCDMVKTSEIFLNIISNAYKYTPAGGKVTIAAVELPSPQPGIALMEITVTDTGIGMSQEFLPRLFEEFSREHTSTDSKIQGTGLGMPIVKKLVELMGGTITVESELGKGTKFTVTIPHRIAEGIKTEETQISAENIDHSGRRILVAEDNDLNAEIITEILDEAGFAVEHAADGVICVDMMEKAEAGYYDLILMDIQMPNMDGYKATRTIRSLSNTAKAQIPIVAMTANAFDEDRQNAIAAGMNAHLSKPIDINLLMQTLNEILPKQPTSK
ncbi:MAG: ATP-binding protein, partial [Bacteroidales bacterium]|nr:ATP-binding protein [Bacteroidales bacterium]